MKISEFESQQALWKKIEEELTRILQVKREKNDGSSLDAIQTAQLRGEISVVKQILAWAKPDQKIE